MLEQPRLPRLVYHGPRNFHVNNSQGNNSCNCNCNLAAQIILEAIIYVIVNDAFVPWETEAHSKFSLSKEREKFCSCNCNPTK